jgi:hypothetical protein
MALCRGFGIAKFLKSGNVTLTKAVNRWISVNSGVPDDYQDFFFRTGFRSLIEVILAPCRKPVVPQLEFRLWGKPN